MQTSGAPVGFREVAIRSLVGLIDVYLFSGIVGAICILVTPKHQRLGDLAAGTVVVRENHATVGRW